MSVEIRKSPHQVSTMLENITSKMYFVHFPTLYCIDILKQLLTR